MTFDELALEILRELIRKSGVREWEAIETQAALTQTACNMAATILYYQGESEMAKEIYIVEGTPLKINGEADAAYAWSMEAVANGAGRVSARIDLGTAPRPYLYRWHCKVPFQATPTAGNELRLRKSESDGTYEDGDLGVVDAALAAEPTGNCRQFGSVKVQAAGTQDNIASGIVEIYSRYVSIVGWNASGAAVDATDSNFFFSLTPIYDQQQA